MVQANEVKRVINQFFTKAEYLPVDFNETIDALLNLKTTVSERIARVQRELSAIAEYIKGY